MSATRPTNAILPRHRRLVIGVAAIVVLLIILGQTTEVYTDYLWFDALGYSGVFATEFWTKVVVGLAAFIVTAGWLAGNVALATRLSPGYHFQVKGLKWTVSAADIRKWLYVAGGIFGVVIGFGVARGAAAYWYEVLQFLHRAPFGWVDPVLENDAGLYVFVLPVLGALKGYLIAMVVLGSIGAAVAYFLSGAIGWQYARISRPATLHLAGLGAGLLLAVAFGYALDRYALLLAPGGAVFGAGYVDAQIRMPVYLFMMVATVVAAVAVVVAGIRTQPKIAAGTVVVLVVAHVAAAWMYPVVQQRFEVEPNELVRETPFIAHNIAGTRFAFGLSDVQEQAFPAKGTLTSADLRDARDTIANVRLWDYRALRDTYNEIQGLRTYYGFTKIDTDRYRVGDAYRQVSLAVRELRPEALEEKSQTWVNLHLLYTHGYGLCMSPVNAVTESGMPELWIRDIPPRATVPITVSDASIYFGEWTWDPVYVRTLQDEFHYPLEDENVYTQYEGDAGIPIGSWLRRLLFAFSFDDWNILLTDSFTAETQLLWRRQIEERVHRIAPFLAFDNAPYPVVADEHIVWIIDAYTYTTRFPYATPARLGKQGLRVNYVRNAVKVTVDARTGAVRFYVADPDDAIVTVARRIFPDLFRDLSEMPESLRDHLRYPIDLLDIQAEQYFTYHMTDPRVFYNKEDLWQRPSEMYRGNPQPVKAYYIIMRVPGQARPEYLLMLPVTPVRKNNMVAWMAGRCDPQHYGKLLVYKFPKDRLVLGPKQIEANIDKNDAISQQITLWDQAGSRVLRGNLLVIPVGDAILYVEPLYLESEQTRFPELRRVIVATKDRTVMRKTLEEALEAVLGDEPAVADIAPPPGHTTPAPTTALGARALEAYQDAQQHLKEGDWTGYGQAMERLETLLQQIAGPRDTP